MNEIAAAAAPLNLTADEQAAVTDFFAARAARIAAENERARIATNEMRARFGLAAL
jgi:hypothetical protein